MEEIIYKASQSKIITPIMVLLLLTNSKAIVIRKSRRLIIVEWEQSTKNAVAEQNIKTVSSWGRANMLHLAYHWPARAKLSLWPLAIAYAVWV